MLITDVEDVLPSAAMLDVAAHSRKDKVKTCRGLAQCMKEITSSTHAATVAIFCCISLRRPLRPATAQIFYSRHTHTDTGGSANALVIYPLIL